VSELAIRVEGLGKRYRLGERQRYRTLRESLTAAGRRLLRPRQQRDDRGRAEYLWAVRDVSFDVARGDVIGVIGRNGAGKSTLLKILSRITEPTEGRVEMDGRIASLLEVGTGFHPELTGRENIYLNGAILGMTRAEIRRRLEEIVAFSEVERFLDTPVKRYSSGMYVRLAFAVAAHVEPEILVIDEVLAVGDAAFQRKCLGKMSSVAGEGRTVLFVSHDLLAVEKLCGRCVLLDSGTVRRAGSTAEVIRDYVGTLSEEVIERTLEAEPSLDAQVCFVALCDSSGAPARKLTTADTPVLRIECLVRRRRPDLKLAFALSDSRERPVFASCPPDAGVEYPTEPGRYSYLVRFPGAVLMPHRYSVTVSLYSGRSGAIHNCPNVLSFDVAPALSPVYGAEPGRVGVLQIACAWHRQSPDAAIQGIHDGRYAVPRVDA
jgi:lipopolysaccharide transport system ATP-binding protein